jgi:hypothetical protein
MMSGCIICNYLVVLGFLRALHMLDNNIPGSAGTYDENSSALCLAYYLCPIGWVPTFVMGIIAAFIFDAYRPYLHQSAYLWGILCDIITLGLVSQAACTMVYPQNIRPGSIMSQNDLGIRAWAAILSRIYSPLMVLWLYPLAVGKGVTSGLFSRPYFVEALGPISYFCYLFHQLVGPRLRATQGGVLSPPRCLLPSAS